jgi:hypothetical protein
VRERLLQVVALDVLQDQDVAPLPVLGAVDPRDIGVIEGGQQLGLAVESRQTFLVHGETLGKDLQGDVPIQLGVTGAIHLAHATGPDLLGDLVMCNLLSDHGTPILDY